MYVSLVALRLETADHCAKIPHLQYKANQAPASDTDSSTDKLKTYAQALGAEEVLSGVVEDHSKHLGRREYREIIIETFESSDMSASDTTKDMSNESHLDLEESLTTSKKKGAEDDFQLVSRSRRGKKPENVTFADSDFQEKDESETDDTEAASSKVHKARKLSREASLDASDEGSSSSSRHPSSKGRQKSHSPTSKVPSTIHFFSGNPSVETTEGIIHLYKENHMTSLEEGHPRSEMICILAVPTSMTSQDLLQFIGPVEEWVEQMKIIRDGTPNQYMVLVKFRTQKYADDFYKNFNNISFNSLESDVCQLVYVASVEAVKASEGACLPITGLTELPTCPVCLERMDESVDGILTILCNHSFHGACLAKWRDMSCPVCRYVQTPESVSDNKCFKCSSQDNLWICLICGHVGCGRYEAGHAYIHYQETQHTYAMQLGNNRVWDYTGDNYVHRLIQNKGDGKLVELDEGGQVVDEDKLDSLNLEYTYLLTSQLEAQRHHFEEKIGHIELDALKRVEDVESGSKKAIEECHRLEQQLAVAVKDRQSQEKKNSQLQVKLNKIDAELREERHMNECLRQNQTQWQKRVSILENLLKCKDQEIKELQEQMRDVMLHFEASSKLAASKEATQEEIQEGHILVTENPSSASGGKSRKKGRKS